MNRIEVNKVELCRSNYAFRADLIDSDHIKDFPPEYGLTENEAIEKLIRKLERQNVKYEKQNSK
jgi:hypothetical protein